MPNVQPIVIRKKAVHAGHNGGAWKVAYADFVTAMMALFIVLWLLNSSKQIQVAVGGYFKMPGVFCKQPLILCAQGIVLLAMQSI